MMPWADDSQANGRLECLESTASVPESSAQDLVLVGIHAVAEAGASWIEQRFIERDPGWVGLLWTYEAGAMRLHVADVP